MPAGITWLGHSTVLVEVDGVRILTDPVLRSHVGPLVRVAPPVRTETLHDIDVVVLSHLHADHVDLKSLRILGDDVTVIAPLGTGAWLRRRGVSKVREIEVGEAASIGSVSVTATHALHDGRRHRLAPHSESIGFLFRGSSPVYFAGDTDLFPEMEVLSGAVDVALVPVAGWGPTVGPGHLDPPRAAEAVRRIGPALAIPIHWGTLALPWAKKGQPDPAPAREFAAQVPDGTEVRVLSPGESTAFP